MRKKFITFLLAFSLTSSMLLTACGNKETDSGGNKTEAETEAPADDKQSDDSEKSEDVTTEEEDAVKETEDSSAESETHEPYTADDVTDEMMQELYASIKDSVTTEYLEPNNISPSDFVWPDPNATDWRYFYEELHMSYTASLSLGSDFSIPESAMYTSDANKEIFDSAFIGFINFFTACDPYEAEFYNTISDKLRNDHSLIVNNVTFN